ncbi:MULTISPECIES: hypothetical protein [unclassified Novosphingobium]|uniref:hypothetical protein n=1 Tax=unclassified Novosphingobium TaxID=2644732 RepID=UPI001AC336FC|nr:MULTISPECIES: hypothetical protein [unclassified Novosphingobium]MBN9145353.1 hypothetical protein [Novosphingobium sp.]MDR6709733.1 hypothetical protein [Novosphingobium sp. 1748]
MIFRPSLVACREYEQPAAFGPYREQFEAAGTLGGADIQKPALIIAPRVAVPETTPSRKFIGNQLKNDTFLA